MLTVTLTDQEAIGLYVAASVGLEEAGEYENSILADWGSALPDTLRGHETLGSELRSRGLIPVPNGGGGETT